MNENSTATNQVNQATQTALEGFEPVPVVSEKEKAREEARTLKERFHNAVSVFYTNIRIKDRDFLLDCKDALRAER